MSVAQRLDAADGVIDGKYYGRPIIERRNPVTPTYRPVAALDVADPVIDGRYYGRSIVESPASRFYGAPTTRYGGYYSRYGHAGYPAGYTSSTAAALDAADGVIDGKYYGRPIVETSAGYPVRRAGYYPAAPVTQYAGRYYDDGLVNYGTRRYVDAAPVQPYYDDLALGRRVYNSGLVGEFAERPIDGYYAPSQYRSSAALQLDAADGVIDGRYYGRPIVEAPARRYVGGAVATRYEPADGVIDSRYYGRPIVEAPARRYVGGSVAERLDAADGVIDGKYFGRPIIQA